MSVAPDGEHDRAADPDRVYHCPIEVTLDLVGGRWKPLILWHLDQHGVLRNGELRRLVPTITQKVLTQQLRQLEADELVARTAYDEVPPRVEYRLTDEGRSLQRMLTSICDWGEARAGRTGITFIDPLTGRPKHGVAGTTAPNHAATAATGLNRATPADTDPTHAATATAGPNHGVAAAET